MNTTTYTVTGMTCDHCRRSVSAEVGAVAGVTAVDVDLTTGKVTVS
ncbi:MAG TPA: cation transporter, partial [Frankiaceae bacterium]|nr:cation transporter [Frankiaceae bacterium]